jgi:hypothetical protein
MAHVPQPPHGGQASRRHAFVFTTELEEAIADLDAVAADGLRAPKRRKFTRAAARERYQRAKVALAWLRATFAAPAIVEPSAEPGAGWGGWLE